MVCEKYEEALIEAAVSGGELAPAVREHVESCANCAAELDLQRSLAAAIDGSLHQRMNAPVPAAMLQRLEARVAQQATTISVRSPRLRFVYGVGALAAAALIVLFVWHSRSIKRDPQVARVAPAIAEPSLASETQLDVSATSAGAKPVVVRAAKHRSELDVQKKPEVLVPPEERIAMEHFMADLHRGGEIALARAKRVTEQPEQPIVPVDAPDIQIVALKVQPIRDTAMGSDK